jgi:tetratricopeptide (TPR) repeat protein
MKKGLAAGLFLAVFGVYLFTMVPTLTEDDSGELSAVGATLGIAHSPGYPLFSLISKSVTYVIPWANYVYRVNLVSALFSALAAVIVFLCIFEITKDNFLSLALSLVFSFSRSVWQISNVTEVYGIAVFFAAAILFSVLKEPKLTTFAMASFLLGLGTTGHYTVLFLSIGIMWWIYANKNAVDKPGLILIPGIFFVLGLSILAYIYVRARQNPLFSWEDPRTLQRFWQVIARLRYGSLALAQGGMPPLSASVILSKLAFFSKMLSSNVTFAGLVIFLYGLFISLKDRNRGWPVVLFLIFSGPVFLLMANVGMDPGSGELLKRFLFLSMLFVVAIMALGLARLPKKASYIIILIPLFIFFENVSANNHRNELIFYDYARDLIRSVPPGSTVFSDRADEMEFSVAYTLFAEKNRKKINFVDCNAGITKSIYGDDYYMIWGKRRLERRLSVESAIISASAAPVYYFTFDPGMIDIPRFQEGLVYRAKPVNRNSTAFSYSKLCTLRLGENSDSLDKRSKNLICSYFDLLGRYELSIGDETEADKNFSGLVAYDTSKTSLLSIGYLYLSRHRLDKARSVYEKAAGLGVADSELYTNLGTIYEALKESNLALESYKKAVALNEENSQAHYNLAVLYWGQGNWNSVIKELQKVTDLDPKNLEAKSYLDMAWRKAVNSK